MAGQTIDAVDRAILDLLGQNARRTIVDIAKQVNLSPAPVKRRIQRLEEAGVIVGYSLVINHAQLDEAVEAFIELRFAGTTDFDAIVASVSDISEVEDLFTTAGDPDALAYVRARDIEHLKLVINRLRLASNVTGTKTLMTLDHWSRPR